MIYYVPKKVNQTPVTDTTLMIICNDIAAGNTIADLSYLLQRPMEEIEQLLEECKTNGLYIEGEGWRYNKKSKGGNIEIL